MDEKTIQPVSDAIKASAPDKASADSFEAMLASGKIIIM
jgi:hypothetical protein